MPRQNNQSSKSMKLKPQFEKKTKQKKMKSFKEKQKKMDVVNNLKHKINQFQIHQRQFILQTQKLLNKRLFTNKLLISQKALTINSQNSNLAYQFEQKLQNCEKNIKNMNSDMNNSLIEVKFEGNIQNKLRLFKISIKQESSKTQKNKEKLKKSIMELGSINTQFIQQEQKLLTNSFNSHYNALQKIFHLIINDLQN